MTSFNKSFQLSPYIELVTYTGKRQIPVAHPYLATWRLREPKSPLVLQGVLDVEVVLVVEDGDGLAIIGLGVTALFLAVGGDGDCRQVDLLVHVGRFGRRSSHTVGS